MKNIKRWIFLLLIAALIGEALPFGAVIVTQTSLGPARSLYSYFDLAVLETGAFGPILTAACTCLLLLFVLILQFREVDWLIRLSRKVACVGVIGSVSPLFFGIRTYSVLGLMISLILIGCFAALCRFHKTEC